MDRISFCDYLLKIFFEKNSDQEQTKKQTLFENIAQRKSCGLPELTLLAKTKTGLQRRMIMYAQNSMEEF